ncbi:dihydrofolate reductase family protein [Bacillus sp. FSL W8-1202]|uniref:dihydrofolate reductase family protein n=1 Tax=Bacillus sp. FSL W8-1202 TaxID=2954649 RepID=UPI0030FCCC9A
MTNNLKQRRIILDLAVTLDGFIEGKNGEVDWCIMDPDMGFTDFFSRTQNEIDNQAVFINDNILEEVNKLKKKSGKDIWLYGGASIITTFINLGLVDEFRLSIHPVVLGEGKPLFIDVKQRINLKMVNTRTFSSGVVQIVYHWNG